jgi:hypothetical protein
MLGMSVRKFAMLTVATALLGAVGGAVQAAPTTATQATSKPMDFTVRAETLPLSPGAQVMKWDAAKGRWGVTLNLQQPEARAAGPVYALGGVDNKKARLLKDTGLVGLAAVDAFRT